MKYKPVYSGPNRSWVCICGHHWSDHRFGCVTNNQYYNETRESYVPEECEVYDCNETGGLDTVGQPHCFRYKDKKAEKTS